jgi:CRP-like cAMP-binding protein
MRTGQYIKNTVLVLSGSIKIYREDEDGGEFFMYYLKPGQVQNDLCFKMNRAKLWQKW